MLVYDPMTRPQLLRRAELDVLAAAATVVTMRRRGAMTPAHLDELDRVNRALSSVFRGQLDQAAPPDPLGDTESDQTGPAMQSPPGDQ